MMVNFEGRQVRMLYDRVLIQKEARFDAPKAVGSIEIPNSVNLNIRMSKIGRILGVGWGNYNSKGKRWETEVQVGQLVYYTRYGKDAQFDGVEGEKYIICRESGVLAWVRLGKDEMPEFVSPRENRLWVKEIPVEERKSPGGIILATTLDSSPDALVRYEIKAVGPGKMNHETGEIEIVEAAIGEKVWAPKTAGVGITWHHRGEREEYRIISFSECFGKA